MLKLSALVRLLKPWSFKCGRGLTKVAIPLGFGGRKDNYALNRRADGRACVCWLHQHRLTLVIAPLMQHMKPTSVADTHPNYPNTYNTTAPPLPQYDPL